MRSRGRLLSGRIVRLAAVCLILAAAVLLFQHTQKNELIAEQIAGCRNAPSAPERAIQDCTSLLELGDQDPAWVASLHRLLGRGYIGLEDWQHAMTEVNKAKTLNPDDYYVWQYTSFIQRKLGDSEAAFDAMETAYRLAPFHENTVKLRFWVLQDLARYDEADAYFSELIKTHPVAEYEHLLWMPRMLGKLRLELKQYRPAAEAYKIAFRMDLNHDETFDEFFEACQLAGPDCPPLFPERRASYPVLSCEEAIQEWGETIPSFMTRYCRNLGMRRQGSFSIRADCLLNTSCKGFTWERW